MNKINKPTRKFYENRLVKSIKELNFKEITKFCHLLGRELSSEEKLAILETSKTMRIDRQIAAIAFTGITDSFTKKLCIKYAKEVNGFPIQLIGLGASPEWIEAIITALIKQGSYYSARVYAEINNRPLTYNERCLCVEALIKKGLLDDYCFSKIKKSFSNERLPLRYRLQIREASKKIGNYSAFVKAGGKPAHFGNENFDRAINRLVKKKFYSDAADIIISSGYLKNPLTKLIFRMVLEKMHIEKFIGTTVPFVKKWKQKDVLILKNFFVENGIGPGLLAENDFPIIDEFIVRGFVRFIKRQNNSKAIASRHQNFMFEEEIKNFPRKPKKSELSVFAEFLAKQRNDTDFFAFTQKHNIPVTYKHTALLQATSN